jgi:hypothetical protein
MATKILIALTVAFAIGRIFITPRLTNIPSVEQSFETFAHLFVGGLIGISWYDRKSEIAQLYGWLGWVLSLWELGWWIAQKVRS